MSGSLNKVMIIGNLGQDPEVKAIPNGTKVANFTICTSEKYKRKDGTQVNNTEWHRIVMWRGLAEIAEKYLRKGSNVYIEGKLTTRSWDDKNGQKRYTTEIVADNMQMLGGNKQGEQAPQSAPQSTPASGNMPPAPEDDLPF